MYQAISNFRLTLTQWPSAILVFFLGQILCPFVFLLFLGFSSFVSVQYSLLVFVSLMIVPGLVGVALLLKHHHFYTLFLLECALLLSVILMAPSPEVTLFSQVFLAFSMVYISFLVGSPALLYPLMTRNTRLWRRAFRYRVGRSATVIFEGQELGGFIEDCSVTGMSISFHETNRKPYCEFNRGTLFDVRIQLEEETIILPLQAVWNAKLPSGDLKVGCESRDRALSRKYLSLETGKTENMGSGSDTKKSDKFDVESHVRSVARFLWLISSGFVLIL